MNNKRNVLICILIILIIILTYVIYFGIENILLKSKYLEVKNNISWFMEKRNIYTDNEVVTINNGNFTLKKDNNSIKICDENNNCDKLKYSQYKGKITIPYDKKTNFGGETYTIDYKNNKLLLIKENNKNNDSKIVFYFRNKKDNILKYLISYKEENYNDKDELTDYKDNDDYLIKIENNTLILCQSIEDKCTDFNYSKDNDKYKITPINSKDDNLELSFVDTYDTKHGNIIKMTKKNNEQTSEYTIIYFKYSTE